MLDIISVLLNVLRLGLCPSMWSVPENVSCVPEKTVCSEFLFVFGYNVLKISVKSVYSLVSFRFSVALWIFCLDLSLAVGGVLKSPAMIVFPSVSPFLSINAYFVHLGAPVLGVSVLASVEPSSCTDLFILILCLLYLPL